MPVDNNLPPRERNSLYILGLLTVILGFFLDTAALRFQPTKRPQLAAQKPKAKAPITKPALSTGPVAQQASAQPTSLAPAARAPPKTSIADWTGTGDDEDVNGFYGGEKRQRGGRKKRKKNKEDTHIPQNWDDIYDPSRPNSYDEYKNSDEKIREVREWKDRLYAHRMARHRSFSDSDDNSRPRPQLSSEYRIALLDLLMLNTTKFNLHHRTRLLFHGQI